MNQNIGQKVKKDLAGKSDIFRKEFARLSFRKLSEEHSHSEIASDLRLLGLTGNEIGWAVQDWEAKK